VIDPPNPPGTSTRPEPARTAPARIAAIYLVSCLAWIWLSDLVLSAAAVGTEMAFWVGAVKASAFVLASAAALFWLIRREVRALTRALGLLQAVVDGTTDAVFVKDRDGKYLMANEATVRFAGRPVAEILGRSDADLFDAPGAALVCACDRRVMASGRTETTEDELVAAGEARTYLATRSPYRDAGGTVLGVVGIARAITDRKRAESERAAHLRYFESMDRVNRALHGSNDLDRTMSAVLDAVLTELGCDRAWLVYPCDPAAPTWTVPMERTRPGHPGAGVRGPALPVTPEIVRTFTAVLGASGPVRFGPGAEHPLPADTAERFSIRSQLAMVIYPLMGAPWVFGLHQCTHPRVWTPEDERLFREIGRRLADTLTGLIAFRDLRTSEERYRALVELAPDAIITVRAGRVAFANAAAARMVRAADPAALVGLSLNDHIHPDDLSLSRARQETVLRDKRTVPPQELRLRGRDGEYIDVEVCGGPCLVGGEPGIQFFARDVTERRRAAALLAHQNAVLEGIATGAPLASALDEIVRIVEAEIPGVVCSILLLDRDGQRLRIGAAPHLPSEYNAAVDGVAIGPQVGSCGTAAFLREAVNVADIATDPLWAEYKEYALVHGLRACWSTPIFGAARGAAPRAVLGTFAVYGRATGAPDPRFAELIGRAEHLASVAIERERADRDLRESEERFRAAMVGSLDAVYFLTAVRAPDGRITDFTFSDVNPKGEALVGLARAALVGKRLCDVLPVNRTGGFFDKYVRVVETRTPLEEELPISDAFVGWLHHQIVPLGDGVVITSRDITARKRSEAELRGSEERLRLFIDHVAAPIAMFDRDLRYVHVSRRWLTDYRLGDRALTGLGHYDVFPEVPERWREIHRRCLAGAVERCEEDRFERADGTVQWLRWEIRPWHRADGAVGGIVMFTEDITARKRMEAQLQQSQKMEAVGRLAGGIAHDFNNLLTVINGFCDLILRGMAGDDPHRGAITEVRSAGERAARLTQQLLAYSRKALIEPKVIDLNALVSESVELLRRLIGEDIVVSTGLQPAPARIRADRGQIEQVVMNLVVNARDAMPTGGRVTVETRTVALGPDDLPDDPDLEPGCYVRLTVADTGAGMTEEVRAHVFEPFFTTKGVGKGTGLGLAVVHGAVKQSGGHIGVSSAVGAGTTFTLLFPAVADTAAHVWSGPDAPARGAETVLLAEDEGAVRTIARLALESYGYTVLAVGCGTDALDTAAAHAGEIAMLVTDVVMPGMSGRQLAEELRRRQPGLRVLFMSGYTDDVVVRHGLVEPVDAFIQKPFSPEAIAQKVREMLDRQKGVVTREGADAKRN